MSTPKLLATADSFWKGKELTSKVSRFALKIGKIRAYAGEKRDVSGQSGP